MKKKKKCANPWEVIYTWRVKFLWAEDKFVHHTKPTIIITHYFGISLWALRAVATCVGFYPPTWHLMNGWRLQKKGQNPAPSSSRVSGSADMWSVTFFRGKVKYLTVTTPLLHYSLSHKSDTAKVYFAAHSQVEDKDKAYLCTFAACTIRILVREGPVRKPEIDADAHGSRDSLSIRTVNQLKLSSSDGIFTGQRRSGQQSIRDHSGLPGAFSQLLLVKRISAASHWWCLLANTAFSKKRAESFAETSNNVFPWNADDRDLAR